MGRKVFVSYKYKYNRVAPLNGYHKHTVRDYVDYLQDHKYSGDDYNKAENNNENLSDFKKDTIKWIANCIIKQHGGNTGINPTRKT